MVIVIRECYINSYSGMCFFLKGKRFIEQKMCSRRKTGYLRDTITKMLRKLILSLTAEMNLLCFL